MSFRSALEARFFARRSTALALMPSTLLVVGCSGPVTWLLGVPPPGIYTSSSGSRFKIDTTGMTAMSLQAEKGNLCLLFWEIIEKDDEAAISRKRLGIVRLRGQECSNKKFGHLDWTAGYSKRRRKTVIVIPPSASADRKVEPVLLSYARAD